MKTFFSGDHHFYHGKILSYCNRSFETSSEAAEIMLDRWNQTVTNEDLVYYLGDIAFLSKSCMKRFVWKLNGKIRLIRGNHDHYVDKPGIKERFEWIKNYEELKIQDKVNHHKHQLIVLCHYPLHSWNGIMRDSWQLHAHCHGKINHLNKDIFRLDVGVDNFDYNLISLEQVYQIMEDKKKGVSEV